MPDVIPLQRAAAIAAVALLALPLSGCGGAPTDASKTEFCAAATDQSWADDLDADADGEDIADGLRAWGDRLDEVGTPEGISDDAREGFELTADYLRHVESDDFDDLEDAAPTNDDLSDDEQDKVTAFNDYVAETCRPELGIDLPDSDG